MSGHRGLTTDAKAFSERDQMIEEASDAGDGTGPSAAGVASGSVEALLAEIDADFEVAGMSVHD